MSNKKVLLISFIGLSLIYACGSSSNEESSIRRAETTSSSAEAIFLSKCSMCHDFNADKIGPSLAGVQERWGGDKARLIAFIKNAPKVIESGDPYAVALYKKWHQSAMPTFTDLSDKELNDLAEYLK